MFRLPLVKPGQIALLATSVVFSVIPTIFIILRLIARRIAKRRLDAADHFIMAAWLTTVALAVTIILEALYGGFGWHREEVIATYGQDVITVYHIVILPLEIFYTMSISLSKMSLLILYIKVFPISRLTIVSKVTLVTMGLFIVSGFLCTFLICEPFEGNWNLTIPGRHCGSQKGLFGVYGVVNLITDIMVLALPIPSLLGLKLPLLRKVGLVATFAIGFLTCVVSVIRLAYLTTMDYEDITYTGIPFVLMSLLEPALAVSLACIPLLRPLFPTANSRYSNTGTRERVVSVSFPDLNTTNSTIETTRRKRGRSSASVPTPILQYQYEMGISKEMMPIDVQELMPTVNEYHYQAEVSSGHDSDGSSSGRKDCSGEMEITPVDTSNIVVKQEWIVLNEFKSDMC